METQHANIFDVLIAWTPIISIVASAVVAVWVPMMLSKMSKSMATKIEEVKAEVVVVKDEQIHLSEKVEEVHKTTNSKMDALLVEAKKASHGEGMQDERNQQAARDGLKAQGAAAAGEKKPEPEVV